LRLQVLLLLAAIPIHARTLFKAKCSHHGAGVAGMWSWLARLVGWPPSSLAASGSADGVRVNRIVELSEVPDAGGRRGKEAGDREDDDKKSN